MAIVVAFGVYVECCDGKIEPEWAIEEKKRMDFFAFREKLGKQMLTYSPNAQHFPGDQFMRSVTSKPKINRAIEKRKSGEYLASEAQFRRAKRYRTSRLCGNLDKLCHHANSIIRLSKPKICAWCGVNSYTACGVCLDVKRKPVTLHYNSTKGPAKGEMCFYHYHNDLCFGLGRNDLTGILNGVKGTWEKANKETMRENAEHIRKFAK